MEDAIQSEDVADEEEVVMTLGALDVEPLLPPVTLDENLDGSGASVFVAYVGDIDELLKGDVSWHPLDAHVGGIEEGGQGLEGGVLVQLQTEGHGRRRGHRADEFGVLELVFDAGG